MIVLDEKKGLIRLSVNDLAPADDPFEEALAGAVPHRARMGVEVHAAYFKSREGRDYRKEVFVRWEGRWDAYRVVVEGRADGCHDTGRGVVVEELKSTLCSGALLADLRLNRVHAAQCGFYCLLLARSGVPVCGGRVVYISVVDGAQRAFAIDDSLEAWEALFQARLGAVLAEQREERRLARRRAAYARRLAFPFDALRPGQQIMLDDVEGAARDGRIILCSAPTGIGKTAAALFPALRQALLQERKLFFVTAKVSQQTLALDTLRRMVRPGSDICALQLSARERSCPLDELHCMVGHCPYVDGFEVRLPASGLVQRCLQAGVVDGARIRELALAQKLCPFEVSLALAQRASVVVSDYNYVFEPNVALKRFFEDGERNRYLLVVDEAHNLPARAIGYYSPELNGPELAALAAAARPVGVGVYRAAGRLLETVSDYLARALAALTAERGDAAPFAEEPDRQLFERLAGELEPILYGHFLYLAGGGARPDAFAPAREPGRKRLLDPLLSGLLAVRAFCQCCALDPQLFAPLWYREGRLKLLCLDPAPLLRERIQRFHGAVFMSATLTPFDFYSRLLGVDNPATLTLELPSPFPRRNRLFLAVNTIDTTYRRRSRDAEKTAAIIDATVRLRAGNYLAFFPSFAYRDEVVRNLPRDAYRVINQEPAMPTADVLEQLTDNTRETILLCGVMGGVFSEGVDYPGHMAIGAFIVGPGLPQVSPEQELVKAYFENQLGAGFEYAYVNPGMNRVVQAGGRVIRTETDRGFVMLICRRFTGKLYRGKLPQFWQEELVVTDNPAPLVAAFWQGEEPAS
jgi:DNA excision repair protein ERCC-2